MTMIPRSPHIGCNLAMHIFYTLMCHQLPVWYCKVYFVRFVHVCHININVGCHVLTSLVTFVLRRIFGSKFCRWQIKNINLPKFCTMYTYMKCVGIYFRPMFPPRHHLYSALSNISPSVPPFNVLPTIVLRSSFLPPSCDRPSYHHPAIVLATTTGRLSLS